MFTLTNDWATILQPEFEKPYYKELISFLEKEYEQETIYPPREDVFSALNLTSYQDTSVVILGQDPYHGAGQAHGLSFSVKPGVKQPPSLKNIFKELHDDVGCEIPNHGYLVKWAEQGVLMLNTVLTVRESKPNSHKGKGWENFTDQVIKALNEREQPVVFLLWGRHAQEKKNLITNERHHIIESAHPSPFAARKGFFGTKPFSKANQLLKEMGRKEIDWQIPAL
ncbi:uracil-DNA glycosylase [Laceyella sediminis]|jgi:uracil-DNA glycosylase|uniref:Uracil-DNA glycosylase n=1 Tax=Laceyella sediminis TaxID=573074 RepID=A0ABX5EKA1_9BACL|nr:uracil-DNA glycosylase [Laceyella sediminis]PRZ11579.1 uracil-DNA glycosylase [Laceyella sediminis]